MNCVDESKRRRCHSISGDNKRRLCRARHTSAHPLANHYDQQQCSNNVPLQKIPGMDTVLNDVINKTTLDRILIALSGSTASYKAFRWYFRHLDAENKMAIGFMVVNPLRLDDANENNMVDCKQRSSNLSSMSKDLRGNVDPRKVALKNRLNGCKVFEERLREKLSSSQNRRFIFVFEILDEAAKSLCDAAENFHCCLVVLGSSGRYGLVDNGREITRYMLEHCKVPVLVADKQST